MKVSFKTLGCRLNQFETDALVSEFDKKGYEIVDFKSISDITIINTCTVTSQSDHKSRNIIRQAVKSNPNATIVVTGCMAEQYHEQIQNIKGVNLVINNKNKSGIVNKVEQYLKFEKSTQKIIPNEFSYKPVQKSFHTRAAIKIQDGCDNLCSFCIIPQVRGRATSRPVNDIIKNIKETIKNGYKELVITGVNIGRYNYENIDFKSLIKKILAIPGDFRVRISSLEPDGFGTDFIELFNNPKLMPHLHLCLQSGSDKVLLKMRRMYDVETFVNFTEQLLSRFPKFNLTTDIIVGFPGENEEMFKKTTRIVKQIAFSHVHTFKYSVRNGTAAERMLNHVNEETKTKRSEELRQVAETNKLNYYKSFIGSTEKVLVEKNIGGDNYIGYGEHYIPITFQSPINLKNKFVDVKINGLKNDKRLVLNGNVLNMHLAKQPIY